MTSETEKTARQVYDETRNEVGRLMGWIELELDKHRRACKANPDEGWTYDAELKHVRARLIETLAFLSNCESDEIETQLSECR